MKPRSLLLLRAAAIALAGWFVFSPAIHGRFLWDDPVEISGNPDLRGAAGLRRIWLSPSGADYYPLKSTVQWAEWRLWDGRVEGWHLTNLALHVIGALLLWRLLARLGVRLAWLGGLLFAVHPLTVGSVAWISELKNTLSLPLLLLAMIAFVGYDESKRGVGSGGRARPFAIDNQMPANNPQGSAERTVGRDRPTLPRYFLSLGLFLAAMLSKSSVVMFPCVILLYCWWKRGRVARSDLLASAPFFAVSLVLGCVTVWFQNHRAIGIDVMVMPGFASRAATAGPAVWFYLFKSVFPFHPLPIYPPWPIAGRSPLCWLAWAALVAVLAWLWSKRAGWGRHALFGLGFFLLNLVPVLGFVPMYYLHIARVGDQLVYLPLAGLAGLAAAGISGSRKADVGRRMSDPGQQSAHRPLVFALPPSAFLLPTFIIIAAFAIQARIYAAAFSSEESLWTYTLRLNPDAWLAQNNLAGILFSENRFAEAGDRYEQALRIRPDYPEALNGMGNYFEKTGRSDRAIREFEKALRVLPDYPDAHDNLGTSLEHAGRLSEAIAQYNLATEARPDFPLAYYNLGNLFFTAGRYPDAIVQYRKALHYRPDFPEALHNLGLALAQSGRVPEAIAEYGEALRLRPDFPEARNDLGLALVRSGRLSEAIAQFQEALRLRPDFSSVHYNLGLALRAEGRNREAREQFSQAQSSVPPGH